MLINYKEYAMTRGLLVESGTAPDVDLKAIVTSLEALADSLEAEIDNIFAVAQAQITSHVRISMRNNQGTWNRLKNWWQTTWHGKDRDKIESTGIQNIRMELSGLLSLHEQQVLNELMDIMEAGPINQALDQMAPMLQNLQLQIKTRVRSAITSFAKKLNVQIQAAQANPQTKPSSNNGSAATSVPASGPNSATTATNVQSPDFGSHVASTGNSSSGYDFGSHSTSTGNVPGDRDNSKSTQTAPGGHDPNGLTGKPAEAPGKDVDPDDLDVAMNRPSRLGASNEDEPEGDENQPADSSAATEPEDASVDQGIPEKPKRGRGRPRKAPKITLSNEPEETPEETPEEPDEEENDLTNSDSSSEDHDDDSDDDDSDDDDSDDETPDEEDPYTWTDNKPKASLDPDSPQAKIAARLAALANRKSKITGNDLFKPSSAPTPLRPKQNDDADYDDELGSETTPNIMAHQATNVSKLPTRGWSEKIPVAIKGISNPGIQKLAEELMKPKVKSMEQAKFVYFISQLKSVNPQAQKILSMSSLAQAYKDIAKVVPHAENMGRIADVITPNDLSHLPGPGLYNTLKQIMIDQGVNHGLNLPKESKAPRKSKEPKEPKNTSASKNKRTKKNTQNESIQQMKETYLHRLRDVSFSVNRPKINLDLAHLSLGEQVQIYRRAMNQS